MSRLVKIIAVFYGALFMLLYLINTPQGGC
jgi:hypothetical protein